MKKVWMEKKIKTAGAVFALISCITITGISAYFTDKESTVNKFTVGQIGLDIIESKWVEANAKNVTAKQEIAKNPQILNNGINEEYVFFEVVVPYANVKTSNENGSINSAKDVQLFTWDLNAGWTQVGSVSDNTKNKTYTYVYAYTGSNSAVTMAPLEAGKTTPTVFDHVRFANVVEGQDLEKKELEIVINAYGIQTDNLYDSDNDINGNNDDGVVSPSDVWSVLTAHQG